MRSYLMYDKATKKQTNKQTKQNTVFYGRTDLPSRVIRSKMTLKTRKFRKKIWHFLQKNFEKTFWFIFKNFQQKFVDFGQKKKKTGWFCNILENQKKKTAKTKNLGRSRP